MKREKVEQFIEKHRLLTKESVVVVGVSGGSDSIALLHYLWTIKDKWALTIIAAHVDHMFRGEESYQDLLFVKAFCEDYHIQFEGTSVDVPAYMKMHNVSVQVAARECRYDFYNRVLEKYNADYLALAHHGDDQVETMLMRMVRGSYGKALAGIPVRRDFHRATIIRPFLCLTKVEIEQYIDECNLSYRLDPSNKQDDYQRNRFRHHILPLLKKENPNVSERFQAISELLFEDQKLLDEYAARELEKIIIEKTGTKAVFLINKFQDMPISLQRRAIHLILKYLYKGIPSNLATIHINQLLSLLNHKHPSGTLHFPKGMIVIKSYNECTLTIEKDEKQQLFFSYSLSVPGEVYITEDSSIKAEWIQSIPENIDGIDFFICNPEEIAFPLHIRNRKTGDRMTLKGMSGTKKIKDIFIDEKLPRDKRDSWPIVEDANGQILWLPLLKKSAFSLRKQHSEQCKSHYFLLLQYIVYNQEL
ncbi:MAG TPA: tRNA lysidine(34) synthetase TilS [Bacillus bacterium]|nr:tRNA lysidine(34) synthetase TilS [Bacillus sp. (in: firmicutes)]